MGSSTGNRTGTGNSRGSNKGGSPSTTGTPSQKTQIQWKRRTDLHRPGNGRGDASFRGSSFLEPSSCGSSCRDSSCRGSSSRGSSSREPCVPEPYFRGSSSPEPCVPEPYFREMRCLRGRDLRQNLDFHLWIRPERLLRRYGIRPPESN